MMPCGGSGSALAGGQLGQERREFRDGGEHAPRAFPFASQQGKTGQSARARHSAQRRLVQRPARAAGEGNVPAAAHIRC